MYGSMYSHCVGDPGHTLFFAFQCRVRPGAIRRPKWTYAANATNNDEEVIRGLKRGGCFGKQREILAVEHVTLDILHIQ